MKKSALFLPVLQLSLVQFLIANCLEIFGEDVPSLLGESSGNGGASEATGTLHDSVGFGEKQTASGLPGFMGDAQTALFWSLQRFPRALISTCSFSQRLAHGSWEVSHHCETKEEIRQGL